MKRFVVLFLLLAAFSGSAHAKCPCPCGGDPEDKSYSLILNFDKA